MHNPEIKSHMFYQLSHSDAPSLPLFIIIVFKYFIYLFMRDTERKRERQGTGRGRSRFHAGSPMWDSILGLQDYYLGGRQTPNR